MKILEAKGAEGMSLLADLFDPITDIVSDPKILKCLQTKQILKVFKFSLKDHPNELNAILAICNGIDPSEYNKTVPEMLEDLMDVVNDPTITRLFFSQAQSQDSASFGSASEITQAAM